MTPNTPMTELPVDGMKAVYDRLDSLTGMRSIPSILTRSGREFITDQCIMAFLASQSLRVPAGEVGDNATITSATTRIQRAEREIARCHERLEIDHVFVMGATAEDDLVRQDVPMSERHEMPDAVECRDATISLLEQDLKAVTAQLADAVKVLAEAFEFLGGVNGAADIREAMLPFLSTIGEKPDAE